MTPHRSRRTRADETDALYAISAAAELAGMHPQTLRQYDRIGLVIPSRTSGRGRRYSTQDITRLREVQRLSQEEGINLAGVKRILDLRDRLAALEAELEEARSLLASPAARVRPRVFWADSTGQIIPRLRELPARRGERGGALVRRSWLP